MVRKIKKDEWDSLEWLHVYGQHSYHGDVTIRGTPAGLARLRNAIDAALDGGGGEALALASDGEGYRVICTRVSTHAQLGEPEYIYEKTGILMADEAQRARALGLRDPYGKYRRVDSDPSEAA